MTADREVSTAPFPGFSAGVEECWMELDGARMRYLRAGSAKSPSFDRLRTGLLAKDARNGAPVLVLVHGLMGYSFSWRYTMPALAPYATVYAPDMMGAGFSDRAAGIDYSMRGTARRLLRFIAGLGVTSFDLLGTSHGGAVAMMAAAECLEGKSKLHLRRLVLVAPAGLVVDKARAPELSEITPPELPSYLANDVTVPLRYFPKAPDRAFDARLGREIGAYAQLVRNHPQGNPKLARWLHRITAPTLLVWGAADRMRPTAQADAWMDLLPDGHLKLVSKTGHLVFEETPAATELVADFLTG